MAGVSDTGSSAGPRAARMARRLRGGLDFLAQPPRRTFRLVLVVLYATHLISGLAQHAMWRDEAQAWLMVRDATALSDIFHNLAYEGHPIGWYLLLWPLTLVSDHVELIQIAQAATALAVMALVIWRGPFSRLELLLLPLSFPFAFEYAIKSRSYALGTLLLLLFCAAFARRRSMLIPAILIAAMCNVHAFFALIGFGCIAALLIRRYRDGEAAVTPSDGVALAVIAAGYALAWFTARPPADGAFATGWRFDLDPEHLRQTVVAFGAMLFGPYAEAPAATAKILAGVVVLGVALARWRVAPAAAGFVACTVAAIVMFMHLKYGIADWHRATLFVCLVAAIWLARGPAGPSGPALLPRWLFAAVLAAQAAAGVPAAIADRLTPYSAGRDTARHIIAMGLGHAPIFAFGDARSSTVVAYLGVRSAFYAQGMREGSFIVWDSRRLQPFDPAAVLDRAAAVANAIVLDCDGSGQRQLAADRRFAEIGRFAGVTESCVIYRKT
jgi:hypothetical protein